MTDQDIKRGREYLVVKDNELIEKAQYHLTATQQKLINYTISLIKPEDTEFQKYEISVSDFCEICGIDKNHFYTEFKHIIDNLDTKTLWIKTDTKLFKFRWFIKAEYLIDQGKVRLMFDDDIKKYLIGLKKNFTKYPLSNILPMRSKYSMRLYEKLKCHSRGRTIITKKYTLEELREAFEIEDTTYKEYKDFKKRVLEVAIEEINLYSDITVSYEPIKNGRRIAELKFSIQQKDSLDNYIAYKYGENKLDNKKQKYII